MTEYRIGTEYSVRHTGTANDMISNAIAKLRQPQDQIAN